MAEGRASEAPLELPELRTEIRYVSPELREIRYVSPELRRLVFLQACQGRICLEQAMASLRIDPGAGQGSATGAAGALRASLTGAGIDASMALVFSGGTRYIDDCNLWALLMHRSFFRWFRSATLLGAGVLSIVLAFGLFPGPVGKLLLGIGSFYVQLLVGCLVLGVLAPPAMAGLNWLFEQAERGIQWIYAAIGQSYYRRKIEPEIIRTGRLPDFGGINNSHYRVMASSDEFRSLG